MKNHLLILILFLAFTCYSQIQPTLHPDPSLRFTENKGQWENHILCRAQLDGGALFLEQNCLTFNFYDKVKYRQLHYSDKHALANTDNQISNHAFKIHFKNCNQVSSIEKSVVGSDYENFFLGNDKNKWCGRVLNYQKILYKNIYDGIDYEVMVEKGALKYNFYVKPNVSAELIKLEYDGVNSMYLKDGNLVYDIGIAEVIEQKPYAYQFINGRKLEIECKYKLKNNTLTFEFPFGYDKNSELIIDPVLVFAAQSGSTVDNYGMCATWDSYDNFYSGGVTFAIGYPVTTGAYSYTSGGTQFWGMHDVVITKYNKTGTALLFSTYFGGTGTENVTSLIVDNNNNLCFYGVTSSTNFPVTTACYDSSFNGGIPLSFPSNVVSFNNGTDMYVGKFNSNGTSLLASTYLGGNNNDGVNHINHQVMLQTGPGTFILDFPYDSLMFNYGDQFRGEIQVDDQNNIYIASSTRSSNFPTTSNAFDNSLGGKQDAIVSKFNSTLSQLLYSTYLGGSLNESGNALIVNNQEVYITGGTCSSDFPVTSGVYDPVYNGGKTDGYISHINTISGLLMQSTFVGTNNFDQSYFIQNDASDNIYIFGQSLGNMPVMAAGYSNPGTHQFICRYNSNLSGLNLSTVVGSKTSTIDISPSAFSVDKCGNIYLSGWGGDISVNSPSLSPMPLSAPTQSTTDGYDFYLMCLSSNASSLLYGSYFGGNNSREHLDAGMSRIDKKGQYYQSVCAGCGGFDDFPVTPGAWPNTPGNPNHSMNCNNGVFKIDLQPNIVSSNIGLSVNESCLVYTASLTNVNPGTSYVWYLPNNVTTSTSASPVLTFTNAGGYSASLVVYNPAACNQKDSSSIYISVGPMIIPTLSVSGPTLICSGDMVVLNVSGATNYAWSNGSTGPATYINPLVTTTYSVAGSIGACTANAVFTQSVNVCTGTPDYSKVKNTVNIYPNPNSGICEINSSEVIEAIVVTDITGKPVYQTKKSAGYNLTLNLLESANGLYFITVKTNSGFNNFKLMKN